MPCRCGSLLHRLQGRGLTLLLKGKPCLHKRGQQCKPRHSLHLVAHGFGTTTSGTCHEDQYFWKKFKQLECFLPPGSDKHKRPNPLPSNLLYDAPAKTIQQAFGVKLEINEVMEPVLCKSGQPITAAIFVSRNPQVNSKTPLVVFLHNHNRKKTPKSSPLHPVVLPAGGLLV